jgi:O-antigen/teichoic acid export membrane protein
VTGGSTQTPSPLRQTTHSMVSRFALVVLVGATGVVIARTLHPEGRGTYAVAVALANATTALGHLSVGPAHVGLWPGRRDAVTANSVLLGPVLGVLAAAAALTMVASGATGLGAAVDSGLLIVTLLAVPPAVTVLYLNNVLVLNARVGIVDRAMLLASVLQCGGLLAAATAGRLTVTWVVWIWTVTSAVPLLLLLPAARPPMRHLDLRLARRALSLGIRYHAGSASTYLTYRLDVLILGAMASTTSVGLYALAVTLAELIRLPTDALARASLSRQAAGDLAAAAGATIRATRASVLLAAVSVGGLCTVAPTLVPVAYGTDFAGCVPALFGLAPGLFVLCAGRQVNAYLLRLNRPLTMSAMSVTVLMVNVAVNLMLIPRWGIIGCSLASSVSYGLITAMQLTQFCRATGTPVRRLLPGTAELAIGRRWLFRSRDRVAPAVADPLEDVPVAAQSTAACGEVAKLEASFPEKLEDRFGPGDLERVPADPVDQIVPARHAARTGKGPDRAPPTRPEDAGQFRHGPKASEIQRAETDKQKPARPP